MRTTLTILVLAGLALSAGPTSQPSNADLLAKKQDLETKLAEIKRDLAAINAELDKRGKRKFPVSWLEENAALLRGDGYALTTNLHLASARLNLQQPNTMLELICSPVLEKRTTGYGRVSASFALLWRDRDGSYHVIRRTLIVELNRVRSTPGRPGVLPLGTYGMVPPQRPGAVPVNAHITIRVDKVLVWETLADTTGPTAKVKLEDLPWWEGGPAVK